MDSKVVVFGMLGAALAIYGIFLGMIIEQNRSKDSGTPTFQVDTVTTPIKSQAFSMECYFISTEQEDE